MGYNFWKIDFQYFGNYTPTTRGMGYNYRATRVNAVDFELLSIDAVKLSELCWEVKGQLQIPIDFRFKLHYFILLQTAKEKLEFSIYICLWRRNFRTFFKCVDQYALHQLIIKDLLSNIWLKTVFNIKEHLISIIIKILTAFRSENVSVTNPTEILIPDSLDFLWIYALGLIKSPAFKMLGEIKVDEKYANILKLLGVSISKFIQNIMSKSLQNIWYSVQSIVLRIPG